MSVCIGIFSFCTLPPSPLSSTFMYTPLPPSGMQKINVHLLSRGKNGKRFVFYLCDRNWSWIWFPNGVYYGRSLSSSALKFTSGPVTFQPEWAQNFSWKLDSVAEGHMFQDYLSKLELGMVLLMKCIVVFFRQVGVQREVLLSSSTAPKWLLDWFLTLGLLFTCWTPTTIRSTLLVRTPVITFSLCLSAFCLSLSKKRAAVGRNI